MNNREFILNVNKVCKRAIRNGQGYANAFAEVCALVNAEAGQPAHNQLKVSIVRSCAECQLPDRTILDCFNCFSEKLQRTTATIQ